MSFFPHAGGYGRMWTATMKKRDSLLMEWHTRQQIPINVRLASCRSPSRFCRVSVRRA